MSGRHGCNRLYPEAKAGDRFGARTVTTALPRVKGKDERVVWRCDCGETGESYVANLRLVKAACDHARRRISIRKPPTSIVSESKQLCDFGNALRDMLGLDPLYRDGRSVQAG